MRRATCGKHDFAALLTDRHTPQLPRNKIRASVFKSYGWAACVHARPGTTKFKLHFTERISG